MTSGPWKVVAGRPGYLYIVSPDLINGVNRHVAEVPSNANARVDAQLISLAPRMLTLLRRYVDVGESFEQLEAAQAIIAEAEAIPVVFK